MKRTAPKNGKATPVAQARKAGTASATKPNADRVGQTKAAPSKAAPVKLPAPKAPVSKAAAPKAAASKVLPAAKPKPIEAKPIEAEVKVSAPAEAAAHPNGQSKNGAPPALVSTDSSVGLLAAIADIPDAPPVLQLVDDLASGKPGPMANASRVLEEWLGKKPEVLVPAIDRLIGCINSPHKRVAQTAALALPVMGRLAPARVARHLPALTDKFPECSDVAKDGLVATFAALCTASVAYQKRLEPVLDLALSSADPKTLLRWAEVVLPSLKGEPHARARSVVESRLPSMPRPQAQPIATFLGIKLRPLPV